LADFGLSTASDSQVLNISSLSTKHAGGTLRWTSPEILEGVQPINTSSSDIYSFACVSYEVLCILVSLLPAAHSLDFQIFSGLIPFHQMHDHAIPLQVTRGRRPSRPSNCEPSNIACEDLGLDDEMWAVIEKCWNQEPEKRPVAKVVRAFLCTKLGLSDSNSRLDESQSTVTKSSPWGILESIQ
jgi:serine/threonine protein kinase